MPIVISHTPPMELLSRAGYYIGAGELRQQQEEMQQRERMQIRGIEANLLSQQLAQQNQMQRDVWGAQMDQQRLDQQQQHQLELQGNQQQMQQKLAEIRQQDRQEALQAKTRANELNEAQFRDRIEWDQAKHFSGESNDIKTLISEQLSSGMDFETPAQRQTYENLMAEIEKAQANPTLRPIQKAQAVYELSTRLPIPTKRVPTTLEQINEQTVKRPDPNNPSKMVEWGIDRNGLPTVLREPADEKGQGEEALFKEKIAITKQNGGDYDAAFKALTRKEEGGKTIFPTHEEVMKYLDQRSEYADPEKKKEREIGPVDPHSGRKAKRRYVYDPATGEYREK